ncbi:MAG: glycine/sarcosine/betaine reductase complex component C subunit beta [Defluviitaleaceae bacterium]|nr:glycine/sarcosine/betaine reductase complex component C subunit beta [Defluviitaleaceae bacterium]
MNAVIKKVAYTLTHAPDCLVHGGTTQTTERIVAPDSEYLQKLPNHLQKYEDVVNYAPNQTYIGGMTPSDLHDVAEPWYKNPVQKQRFAKFGEIMPQQELYALIDICDSFELVLLEEGFSAGLRIAMQSHPIIGKRDDILGRLKKGFEIAQIEDLVKNHGAEGLYQDHKLIGCVKKAHNIDENLSSHIILENLISKATAVLSVLHLMDNCDIALDEIQMIIDCSEEAVGDMNQRGGGNLAKSVAEIVGFTSATGSDIRAFCAAPTHSLITAASMVKAGTYKHVVVAAGGSVAKLGMNGKDHVKKDMPALEDVIGGFAVLISENDGVSPEILNEAIGWHSVGSGSAPQKVTEALVSTPLEKLGLKIIDVDKFSAEMQNPDVTKPAGAGDVPDANFKMIGALAVMRGEMARTDIPDFLKKHGMPGFAPTQGHIPSGVPFLGFAREQIMAGDITRAMIIGKGSLFLGRMTNLFDGASFVVQKNSGATSSSGVSEEQVRSLIAESLRDFAKGLLAE